MGKKSITKLVAIVGAMSLLFGTVTVSAATISTSMNSEKNTITASAKAGAGSYSFTCKGWEKHPTTNHEVEYNKVIGAGGTSSAAVNFRTDAGYQFQKLLHGSRLRVSCVFNSSNLGTVYVQ